MHRFRTPFFSAAVLLLATFLAVPTQAQHLSVEPLRANSAKAVDAEDGDGFVITNAEGDTLFVAEPNYHVRMGQPDSVEVHIAREGAQGIEVYRHASTGAGIVSRLTDPNNRSWGVYGATKGLGAGVVGVTSVSYVPGNWGTGVLGYSNSSGLGVTGYNAGTGIGGFFFSSDTSNTPANPALVAETAGNGSAFIARRYKADANVNIALFGTGRVFTPEEKYVAGIQGNGRIWTAGNIHADGDIHANGNITSSGADFAERFEVIGEIASYEPGDVLAISDEADRHLERTAEPYSWRIAGVYATKPGVLLGDLAPQLSVPVGVIGVIPTKVTDEGGPIRRGDLLVTSSTPGHAMKGDLNLIRVGMVIGRALQDFDDAGEGVIEVLVNVQ